MDVFTVRPKVAQLTFQLLARSVHPELFHIFRSQTIVRDRYSARINITADGHSITWTSGKATYTEVASSTHQLLPGGPRIVSAPLTRRLKDRIQLDNGVEYSYEFELDRVPGEMFWMIQNQLGQAAKDNQLIHFFNASGRVAIGGFSFVHSSARQNSFHIQAVHTFPDDQALLKTETTFSIRP